MLFVCFCSINGGWGRLMKLFTVPVGTRVVSERLCCCCWVRAAVTWRQNETRAEAFTVYSVTEQQESNTHLHFTYLFYFSSNYIFYPMMGGKYLTFCFIHIACQGQNQVAVAKWISALVLILHFKIFLFFFFKTTKQIKLFTNKISTWLAQAG